MLKTLLLATTLGPVHVALEPGPLRTVEGWSAKAQFAAIHAALEDELAASHRRENMSWIPVYGTWTLLRERARQETLADLRARAETARLTAR